MVCLLLSVDLNVTSRSQEYRSLGAAPPALTLPAREAVRSMDCGMDRLATTLSLALLAGRGGSCSGSISKVAGCGVCKGRSICRSLDPPKLLCSPEVLFW